MRAWYWKGYVYEKLINREKAIESYKKFLESNPQNENVLNKIEQLKSN